MFANKVCQICNEVEKNLAYDIEANSHYFLISYKNNKLIIDEIDCYIYYDECDEIRNKNIVHKIAEIKCNLKDYTETIIALFNAKIEYIRYDYFEYGDIIRNIQINKLIND